MHFCLSVMLNNYVEISRMTLLRPKTLPPPLPPARRLSYPHSCQPHAARGQKRAADLA